MQMNYYVESLVYLCPSSRMPGNFAIIADDTRGKGLIKANSVLPSGTCRFDTNDSIINFPHCAFTI